MGIFAETLKPQNTQTNTGNGGIFSQALKGQTPASVPVISEREQRIKEGLPVGQSEIPSINGLPLTGRPELAKPTFLGSVARGIIKPFAQGVESVKTVAQNTASLASGGKIPLREPGTPAKSEYLGDIYPVGYNKNTDSSQTLGAKNFLSAAGTGAEIASNFVGARGLASLAEQGTKGFIKQSVITGAKTGAAGGALQGGGAALEEGKGAGGVLTDTAIGGVGGGLLGGLLGGATGAYGAVKNLVHPTEELVNQARTKIAEQYRQTLNLTPTQQSKEATLLRKTGDDVYSTLAKHGINLGSEKAPVQLKEVSDQFENAVNHAKDNEHSYFNLDEMIANAEHQVNERIPSETARVQAKNKIHDEINALLKANKDWISEGANGERLVNSKIMERLRRVGNSWTPFNAADPEKIGTSTGYALSNAVRDQVEKEGSFPAYREASKEWGKIIHAQEVLNKIVSSGKGFKVPGGLTGKLTRRVLSGAIGYHTGGIGGAILGEMSSEYGAKILANPELRTWFDRKLIENFEGKQKITPEVITKLEQEVRDYLSKQSSHLQLPAGNKIDIGTQPLKNESGAIPLGPRSSTPSVQLLPAQKNPVSVNPKTGKFQTSYNSDTL